jgi:hypothetical protein
MPTKLAKLVKLTRFQNSDRFSLKKARVDHAGGYILNFDLAEHFVSHHF